MPRPISKDHGAKRDAILKTAAEVFAREGITRASMTQVAEACGMAKANVYHYYPSKDALLFDILDTYLRALRDRLAALPDFARTPQDRLRDFTRETLLAYQGMDNEHKLQAEGLALLPARHQVQLKAYQHDMVRQLSAILKAAAPEQLGADQTKLREATMSVFGMLNWHYMWHRSADAQARVGLCGDRHAACSGRAARPLGAIWPARLCLNIARSPRTAATLGPARLDSYTSLRHSAYESGGPHAKRHPLLRPSRSEF